MLVFEQQGQRWLFRCIFLLLFVLSRGVNDPTFLPSFVIPHEHRDGTAHQRSTYGQCGFIYPTLGPGKACSSVQLGSGAHSLAKSFFVRAASAILALNDAASFAAFSLTLSASFPCSMPYAAARDARSPHCRHSRVCCIPRMCHHTWLVRVLAQRPCWAARCAYPGLAFSLHSHQRP